MHNEHWLWSILKVEGILIIRSAGYFIAILVIDIKNPASHHIMPKSVPLKFIRLDQIWQKTCYNWSTRPLFLPKFVWSGQTNFCSQIGPLCQNQSPLWNQFLGANLSKVQLVSYNIARLNIIQRYRMAKSRQLIPKISFILLSRKKKIDNQGGKVLQLLN